MTTRCPVCGQEYGLTHACPGPITVDPAAAAEWNRPEGLAAGHYLRLAWAIARFEDAAITAAAQDKEALFYGGLIWIIGQIFIFAGQLVPGVARGINVNWAAIVVGVVLMIFFDAILVLAQYGLCHLLARWWFGATGSYLGILRAMLLGSIVVWVAVIPLVGIFVAGLWALAVLMRVFEEVDGIERMQAFGLSFGVGALFMILNFALLAAKR
jgi:hypothetical protein